jgi:hypothetical protein
MTGNKNPAAAGFLLPEFPVKSRGLTVQTLRHCVTASPFTIHHSPFTIHHSPFTIHHSRFSS